MATRFSRFTSSKLGVFPAWKNAPHLDCSRVGLLDGLSCLRWLRAGAERTGLRQMMYRHTKKRLPGCSFSRDTWRFLHLHQLQKALWVCYTWDQTNFCVWWKLSRWDALPVLTVRIVLMPTALVLMEWENCTQASWQWLCPRQLALLRRSSSISHFSSDLKDNYLWCLFNLQLEVRSL